MQTIEQFSNQLLDRWKELHPEYKKPKEEPKPKVKGLLTYPPSIDATQVTGVDSEDKVPIDLFNKTGGISEAVFNRAKKKLRDPITWVGPMAIGEEKFLKGWWAVVLPDSVAVISFFGPLARKRAIEKAESLKGEYE